MEALVLKYLNKNYSMSSSDYLSGVVTDKDTKKNLMIIDLMQETDKVFGLGSNNCRTIITKWWDQKELPFIQAEMSQHTRR